MRKRERMVFKDSRLYLYLRLCTYTQGFVLILTTLYSYSRLCTHTQVFVLILKTVFILKTLYSHARLYLYSRLCTQDCSHLKVLCTHNSTNS